MQNDIAIRPAVHLDLDAIARIYSESVLNGVATYELTPPDLSEMTNRFNAITGQGYPYIVAERDGEILGYAYASAFRTRAAYRFMVEDSIYLAPAARGLGIGRKLLDKLIDECTRLGFRQMVAVIGGAHPASIAVHRSAGFADSGTIIGSGYKFGRWLDTVLMQISLGEGNKGKPEDGIYPDTLYR